MRFVSAQLAAYLEGGLWLAKAAQANALAAQLGDGLAARQVALAAPVQTNMVFARLKLTAAARLRAAGAVFHDWGPGHG